MILTMEKSDPLYEHLGKLQLSIEDVARASGYLDLYTCSGCHELIETTPFELGGKRYHSKECADLEDLITNMETTSD